MDAYYASIEQRDNPALRGKPVIIGGHPEKRGVVATASYEARKFGVHSAMAMKTAVKLCPHAIRIAPRFSKYKEISNQIRKVFHSYTELVEPLSLDEAFLDVTERTRSLQAARDLAQEIVTTIFEETALTASAGISFNKFLAKVASDIKKPSGITLIDIAEAPDFIAALPIRKFFGIGHKTEAKLKANGIYSGSDLKNLSRYDLVQLLGKQGNFFYDLVRCKDERPVCPNRPRKSISVEQTLQVDLSDHAEIMAILNSLVDELLERITLKKARGNVVILKVKYWDFKQITRQLHLRNVTDDRHVIEAAVSVLVPRTEIGTKKVRLLGIGIGGIDEVSNSDKGERQLVFPFL